MNKRDEAIDRLKKNACSLSNEHKNEILSLNPVKIQDAGDGYLPGYIPYIGKEYFSEKICGKRILIYALSQNISRNDSFAKDWVEDWNIALDRQNLAYDKEKDKIKIVMGPFDTGHLPVIAAMLLDQLGIKTNKIDSICDFVSATNLSKFSFRKNQNRDTTDNKESLEKCFDRFSIPEIKTLQPNYIICVGDLVFKTITKKINGDNNLFNNKNVIHVDFPSLLVINKKWRKKHLSPSQKTKDDILNMFSNTDLEKKVSYKKYNRNLKYVIERDYLYFSNMYSEIEEQKPLALDANHGQ